MMATEFTEYFIGAGNKAFSMGDITQSISYTVGVPDQFSLFNLSFSALWSQFVTLGFVFLHFFVIISLFFCDYTSFCDYWSAIFCY